MKIKIWSKSDYSKWGEEPRDERMDLEVGRVGYLGNIKIFFYNIIS